MINVTVKQLRYFDAVARLCHFGRAADSCAVTQPALSMQIKELEQLLGGPLLERGAHQVERSKQGRGAKVFTFWKRSEMMRMMWGLKRKQTG